jgi:hypothetical protein
MLEGIHGNDDVAELLRGRYKQAGILNPMTDRPLSCRLECVLPYIDADHPLGSPPSHLQRFGSLSTAEVDDGFSRNLGDEFFPHQSDELRLASVNHSAAATWFAGGNPFQDAGLDVVNIFTPERSRSRTDGSNETRPHFDRATDIDTPEAASAIRASRAPSLLEPLADETKLLPPLRAARRVGHLQALEDVQNDR